MTGQLCRNPTFISGQTSIAGIFKSWQLLLLLTSYSHQPSTLIRPPLALPLSHAGTPMHAPVMDPSVYSSLSPVATSDSPANADSLPLKLENGYPSEHAKKKQKRNKPTLSCEECVERKTKVECSIDCLRFELFIAMHGASCVE